MGYSLKENVKILVSLLKAYNIKNIVLSSGNRNISFVQMVENDDFFTCYSIVDERSAGFFALGLIERLNSPAAICCTSGTA
ncbi:thiamine pyrophosphate-binding protein, partial [Hungatella sp.]